MDIPPENEEKAAPLDSAPTYRRYIVGFIATMLALNIIELCFSVTRKTSSQVDYGYYVLSILLINQLCLLSIWVGLGKIYVTLRCFTLLVFIEGGSLLLPALGRFRSVDIFNQYLLISLMIVLPLWIGRLFGLQLLNINDNYDRVPSQQNRFQFSIRCLLEWTTITAVFMGSLTYIFGKGEGFVLHHAWVQFVIFAISYAIFTFSLIWAALGIHMTSMRIVQAIFIWVTIRFFFDYFGAYAYSREILPLVSLLLCLFFFRHIGFRVAWVGNTNRMNSNHEIPS